MARNIGATFRSLFTKKTLLWFVQSEKQINLNSVVEFLAREAIEPKVEKVFLLEETSEAIQHFTSGVASGLTVIAIGNEAIFESKLRQ